MKLPIVILGPAGAALAALAWTNVSFAQEPDPVMASPAATAPLPPRENKNQESANGLIGAGVFLLASSYLTATVVAESSDLKADQQLYVPVAGPWLDLGRRPLCNASNCGTEFGNRALIATDGLLQGLGAFMTLVGLLTLDDESAAPRAAKEQDRKVHVSPSQFGSAGYGVAAFGRF